MTDIVRHFLVFEGAPSAFFERRLSGCTASIRLGHPNWAVCIYEVTGETKQRYLVRHAGGDMRHYSRDGQGREYIEKAEKFTRHTTNLGEALAYRAAVLTAWAAECAARDRITAPLFAEIERLTTLILEADAVRNEAAARIREEARDWCRPATASEDIFDEAEAYLADGDA